jgi:hypothetical protein
VRGKKEAEKTISFERVFVICFVDGTDRLKCRENGLRQDAVMERYLNITPYLDGNGDDRRGGEREKGFPG